MDHLRHPRLQRGDQHGDDGNKQKRNSLSLRSSSKSRTSNTSSPKMQPQAPPRAKIDLLIESPPLVFYGSPRHSTGALMTGHITLGVQPPYGELHVSSFTMRLRAVVTVKRPVSKDCHDCQQRQDELQNWTYITESKTVRKGDELEFPVSYLFDGGLPATVEEAPLGSIHYVLDMFARTVAGEETKQSRELKIKRAIPSESERTAIRIFPPTNLTGRCIIPTAIYPIGSFPMQLIMSGVVDKRDNCQVRWRLRKVMWRVEEMSRMVSHACPRHAYKIGGQDKGQKHEDIRTIGSGEMKDGWKTDYDTAGGEITLQFEGNLFPSRKPVCDTDTEAGFVTNHSLVIETIVSEERSISSKRPNEVQSTGAARILRMSFAVPITERAGMGISWDEEMPPMYDEVPASPPVYPQFAEAAAETSVIEDYRGGFEWESDSGSPRPRSSGRPNTNSSARSSQDQLPSSLPPSYREDNAFPLLDQMRNPGQRATSYVAPSTSAERGRARGHWTLEELEVEPPQRPQRDGSGTTDGQEGDIGVGQQGSSEIERGR